MTATIRMGANTQDVLRALANAAIFAAASRAVPRIQARLVVLVGDAIRNAPEANSLLGGQLQGELGVVAVAEAIAAISESVQKGVFVVATEKSLQVGILRADLSEVLALAQGRFVSEGGYSIDWLEWLLTAGKELVVADYVFFAGERNRSRTGLGVMKKGQGWRVPPRFAGTAQDNWLTRAISTLEDDLPRVILEEINRT